MTTAILAEHWLTFRDGDRRALWLFTRHYSFNGRRTSGYRNAERFIGNGEHMGLMTATCDAIFTWRLQRFRKDAETGVECNIFHNESTVRSSDLIREADRIGFDRWPGERHFTFVDPTKIRSTNPGACFLRAGWTRLDRRSGRGLVILELLP